MAEIEEIHDLYRVDPAEFVETRAALVKQLRAEGRKDDARVVVKLRKPSAASWALNQVAYDQPDLIAAALEAGDALRDATTETLGGDASNLRAATAAEREAAGAVIDAAGQHLNLTADHRERMSATLRAAAVDDEVREQLVDGLLAADHEPPAMGFAAAGDAATEAAPAPSPRSAKAAAEELAAPPRSSSKRKVRRVGTPSKDRKPAAVDAVDQRRRAKEADQAKAERAEQRRAKEAERERERQRKRRQAELDTAARRARDHADKLEAKAVTAEEVAAAARADADEAATEAEAAEAAATAGPPD
jgi:hypothetical protein